MRKLSLLACLLLVAGWAGAESKAALDHGPQPTLEQLLQVRAADPRFQEAENSRPLFFRLDNPAREVMFGVTVGGRPYVQERVTLGETRETTPAVEMLARDASRLERLYALAANKTLPIEVSVFVDGRQQRRFTFQEFIDYNRELKSGGLRPVTGTSEMTVLAAEPRKDAPTTRAAAAPQPDGPCEDQCYWDYLDCRDLYCNGGGGCLVLPCPLNAPELPDCSYCDSLYNNCLASCPPPVCTDPKSVTYSSTTELVGIYVMYWDCLADWWDPNPTWGYWYEVLQLVYKTTTYRRTEYCDGSVVVEATGVSYSYGYCNHPTWISCYSPWYWAYNVCY